MGSFLTHPVQSSRASKLKFSQPRRIQKRGRTELGSSNVSWLQHGNLMKSYDVFRFFQVRHGQTMRIPRRIPSFFQSFYQPCGYVHDFLQVTTFFASQQWGDVNRSHMKTSKVMMMWWLHVVTVIGIDWDWLGFKLQFLFFSFWHVYTCVFLAHRWQLLHLPAATKLVAARLNVVQSGSPATPVMDVMGAQAYWALLIKKCDMLEG